jgi:hypothetical protein
LNRNTEIIRQDFRPLLRDIHPGQNYKEKIIPLNRYKITEKYIKSKSILIIGTGKLGIDQIGVFCCKKQPDGCIVFCIILNERFQKHYSIKTYARMRKLCIVHEFCHFISIVVNSGSNLLNMRSQALQVLAKIILLPEIYDILRSQQSNDFGDTHFKYNDNDNINYNTLFRNLLLSRETIAEYSKKREKQLLIYRNEKNWEKYTSLLIQLARHIAEEKKLNYHFTLHRISEELYDFGPGII